MTSTMSAASAARRISAAIASGSSGCTSLTTGQAPASVAWEASRRELLSVTSPGPSADPTGRISIPGRDDRDDRPPGDFQRGMPGRGGSSQIGPAQTVTCRDEQLAGREVLATGAHVPPRGAGPVIWALPSLPNRTRSCSTTVSVPAGIRLPVSTQANEVAASCHAPVSSTGPALIAMPSIAARADRGAGQRAWTGAAVTRPSPSRSGTCSTAAVPGQPAAVHISIHRE